MKKTWNYYRKYLRSNGMKQKENECEIVEKILDKLKYNITDDVWKKR